MPLKYWNLVESQQAGRACTMLSPRNNINSPRIQSKSELRVVVGMHPSCGNAAWLFQEQRQPNCTNSEECVLVNDTGISLITSLVACVPGMATKMTRPAPDHSTQNLVGGMSMSMRTIWEDPLWQDCSRRSIALPSVPLGNCFLGTFGAMLAVQTTISYALQA